MKLDCFNDYMREKIREVCADTTVPKQEEVKNTDPDARIRKLERAMSRAMVGGCSCGTKTPVYEFHKDHCGYKILGEALAE